jgi:RNA polymerase sigma factor (sigma-70 family)
MSNRGDVAYLKERLQGPILEEIIDPKDYEIDDILKSYFREILFLAGRYTRPTVDYEDLVVEGLMGLLDAVKRFDIEKAKGNPRAFHNLAVVRIKSYMFEFFLQNESQYSIPNYMSRAINLMEQIRNVVRAQEYTGDADQALLNFECEEFEKAIPEAAAKRLRVVKGKLQRLANNSDKTYETMILAVLKVEKDIASYETEEGSGFAISPEEIAGEKEFMEKFLGNLNPNARGVIEKILEGKTLEESGKEMGFTRERARQIKEDTLKYFKRTPMYKESVDD